jgi:hypothetical protein
MVYLHDEAQVEARFGFCLVIVLILTQDRCTVYTEHTTGVESFWTHPMELLDDVTQVESRFGPFGDSEKS